MIAKLSFWRRATGILQIFIAERDAIEPTSGLDLKILLSWVGLGAVSAMAAEIASGDPETAPCRSLLPALPIRAEVEIDPRRACKARLVPDGRFVADVVAGVSGAVLRRVVGIVVLVQRTVDALRRRLHSLMDDGGLHVTTPGSLSRKRRRCTSAGTARTRAGAVRRERLVPGGADIGRVVHAPAFEAQHPSALGVAGSVGSRIFEAGLVDEVAMDVVPVAFGSGRPFFTGVERPQLLEDPHVVIQGTRVLHLGLKVRGRP